MFDRLLYQFIKELTLYRQLHYCVTLHNALNCNVIFTNVSYTIVSLSTMHWTVTLSPLTLSVSIYQLW